MIYTFFKAFFIIFLGEMGDKSQFLVIALTKKYKPRDILIAIALSIAVLNALAVILGGAVSIFFSTYLSYIKLAAGLLFLFFAISSLKEDSDEEKEKTFKFGPILTIFLTYFVAELGDKTQLTTITLSALQQNIGGYLSVFAGSTIALILVDSLGLFVGVKLLSKVPEHVIGYISATIFAFFGLMTIYGALDFVDMAIRVAIVGMLLVLTVFLAYYMKKKNK